MLIEIEETYNPNVRNFYLNAPVLAQGFAEYADLKTKNCSEGAKNILSVDGLQSVLILPDMVSVFKKEDADFKVLEPQIMAEIVDFDFSRIKDFNFECGEALINALVEAKIRPFLKNDGGDIEVLRFEDGIVYIRLKGRCRGCPHANQTLKNMVEATFKKYILSVLSVQEEQVK